MAAKLSIRRSLSLFNVPVIVTGSLSAVCDKAKFDMLCFPFDIVYRIRTVSVVTGVVGVLGGEPTYYYYKKRFDTEAGSRWRPA